MRENEARVKYCKKYDACIKHRGIVDAAQAIFIKKELAEDYYKEDEA